MYHAAGVGAEQLPQGEPALVVLALHDRGRLVGGKAASVVDGVLPGRIDGQQLGEARLRDAQHHFSPTLAAVSLLVAGAGQGTIAIPSVSAAYAAVPKEQLAIANTAINIVQRPGGPLATTVLAVVMSVSAQAFMIGFVLLVGLHLFTLGSASRLPALIHHRSGQGK